VKESRISISKRDLQEAANNGSMSPLDVEPLWQALTKTQTATTPGDTNSSTPFDLAQLAWYGGGVLVVIAMGWFMSQAGQLFGTGGIFCLSLLYTSAFALLGSKVLKEGNKTPAGVLCTLAVLLTPVTLSALLDIFKLDHFLASQGGIMTVELATAAAAIFALRQVKSSIVSAPIYLAVWAFAMTAILGGNSSDFFDPSSHFRGLSMLVGLAILASAVHVDTRFGRAAGADYSWWGYLVGTAAFWIPLSLLDGGGELAKFIYFLLNIALMLASVVLARRVLLIAGAIGTIYYIGYVLWTCFSSSLLFPLMLIGAGIGLIYLGNKYRRNHVAIDSYLLSLVPASWQRILPKRS